VSARRWGLPIAWAVVILVLTSIPFPATGPEGVRYADKLLHVAVYGVLGWLWMRAVLAGRAPDFARVALVLGCTLFFAALDEWHQRFIPGRSPEFGDWVADATGAGIGLSAAIGSLRRARA